MYSIANNENKHTSPFNWVVSVVHGHGWNNDLYFMCMTSIRSMLCECATKWNGIMLRLSINISSKCLKDITHFHNNTFTFICTISEISFSSRNIHSHFISHHKTTQCKSGCKFNSIIYIHSLFECLEYLYDWIYVAT